MGFPPQLGRIPLRALLLFQPRVAVISAFKTLPLIQLAVHTYSESRAVNFLPTNDSQDYHVGLPTSCL